MLKSNSPVNFSRMKAECLWIPACLCTWGMLVSWDNHTPCHVFCFTWTQNCHRNAYKHFLFSSPAHVAHTWGLLAAGLASAGKGETLPAWKAVPFMWVKSSQSPTVFMACLRTALKTSTSTENSETWGGSELQQRLQQSPISVSVRPLKQRSPSCACQLWSLPQRLLSLYLQHQCRAVPGDSGRPFRAQTHGSGSVVALLT